MGRLTDNASDKLQVYYGKAIRNNTHDMMKNAVMAIWHHTQSTDDSPDHNLYPVPPHHELSLGVAFKRMLHRGPLVINITIPFQRLWLIKSIPPLKPWVIKICLHAACMAVLKTKMRPSMHLSGSVLQRKTSLGWLLVELATFLAVSHFNNSLISIMFKIWELTQDFIASKLTKSKIIIKFANSIHKSSE